MESALIVCSGERVQQTVRVENEVLSRTVNLYASARYVREAASCAAFH